MECKFEALQTIHKGETIKKSDKRIWGRSCYSWWLEKRRSETGMWCSVRASNKDPKKERKKKEKI
jgi:hypothetical protein